MSLEWRRTYREVTQFLRDVPDNLPYVWRQHNAGKCSGYTKGSLLIRNPDYVKRITKLPSEREF
jgi:hypothetical protein